MKGFYLNIYVFWVLYIILSIFFTLIIINVGHYVNVIKLTKSNHPYVSNDEFSVHSSLFIIKTESMFQHAVLKKLRLNQVWLGFRPT